MQGLLGFLRAKSFKIYIVPGGGVELMRPWTEKVYGIPPEQVIGSSIKTKYELLDGKPVGIYKFIGRRPIAAFGNSDGDYQMLQWTTANNGPYFALIVHHTDAEREYAYDREAIGGRLDKALDAAQ